VNRLHLARPAAALIAAAALLAAAPSRAAEPALPPPPQSWVTDTVGYMSPVARQSLAGELEAYERQTGHQVLVWIGATTGDVPIEEFAVKAFEKWKVGRAAKDDGLVFFIFTEDRKMRIEVGYGLEDKVTDLLASQIIREVVAPRLRDNDPDGAITAGAKAILSTIDTASGNTTAAGGETGASAREAPLPGTPRPLTGAQKVLIAVVGIGLLLLLITNPSLAVWLLLNLLSGGGGGRGGGYSGGGGGGWSGGGGRSGGGGASGSW
jgi:uncharacterized protein